MCHCSKVAVVVACFLATLGSAAAQERADGGAKKADRDYPFSASFPTVDARVDALIKVLREENTGKNVDEHERRRERAEQSLVDLGKAAVPKLLDGVEGSDLYSECGRVLKKMGKPAVDDVRARWPKLSHEIRWRLMEFRGLHDYEKAADYALWCLRVDSVELRSKAWGFLLKHKEKRVCEEFFCNLRGESEGPPYSGVIRREPVFDNEKEIDLLIALLHVDSWAARDLGIPHHPGENRPRPDDEREFVIDALKARKAKRAAPALLAMLAERGPGRAYYGAQIIPLLGDFGHQESIPELKRVLDCDPKLFARYPTIFHPAEMKMMAARVLFQFGDARAREFLKPEIVNSGDRYASTFVAASYALYGDKSDIPLLAKWLDHPFWDVQKAACEGLERITGVNIHAPTPAWRKSTYVDAPLWLKWYEKEYGKKP